MGRIAVSSHKESLIVAQVILKEPELRRILKLPAEDRNAALQRSRDWRRSIFLKSLSPTIEIVDSGRLEIRAARSQIQRLARRPFVASIRVLKPKPRQPRFSWYAVVAKVTIDVEGRRSDENSVERRVSLVRAESETSARKKFITHYRRQEAAPYLNAEGYAVRWRLAEVISVYDTSLIEINPAKVVEVLSEWVA